MKYVDVHCHVLPGADDGARDMEQALRMLKQAEENGIEAMIATPHQKEGRRSLTPQAVLEAVEDLQQRARRLGLRICLYPGNELYYRKGLASLLENGQVRTLADSSYALLEFSPEEDFSYLRNGLYEVLSAGYYPILAHAERYRCLLKKEERIRELIQLGVYIQVNAGSVLGELGPSIKGYLHQLLRKRMVHFVATDAHDTEKRGIRIVECRKRLEKKYGTGYAEELLYDNGKCVLEDLEL